MAMTDAGLRPAAANTQAAQRDLPKRVHCNRAARRGTYVSNMEPT